MCTDQIINKPRLRELEYLRINNKLNKIVIKTILRRRIKRIMLIIIITTTITLILSLNYSKIIK